MTDDCETVQSDHHLHPSTTDSVITPQVLGKRKRRQGGNGLPSRPPRPRYSYSDDEDDEGTVALVKEEAPLHHIRVPPLTYPKSLYISEEPQVQISLEHHVLHEILVC